MSATPMPAATISWIVALSSDRNANVGSTPDARMRASTWRAADARPVADQGQAADLAEAGRRAAARQRRAGLGHEHVRVAQELGRLDRRRGDRQDQERQVEVARLERRDEHVVLGLGQAHLHARPRFGEPAQELRAAGVLRRSGTRPLAGRPPRRRRAPRGRRGPPGAAPRSRRHGRAACARPRSAPRASARRAGRPGAGRRASRASRAAGSRPTACSRAPRPPGRTSRARRWPGAPPGGAARRPARYQVP